MKYTQDWCTLVAVVPLALTQKTIYYKKYRKCNVLFYAMWLLNVRPVLPVLT